MLSKKNSKQAFTLVELSVVIVIISIMLSTVLVSRSLIASAKINKIQEEYRTLNSSIGMFNDVYSCLPGDCTATQVPDLITASTALSTSACFSSATPMFGAPNSATVAYNALNTGGIESTFKRTCMMLELQAAGYLAGLTAPATPSALNMTGSVVNVNIPVAKFSKQAAWDYRTIQVNTGTNVLGVTVPYSVSYGSLVATNPMSAWSGKNALVLRDSNVTALGENTPLATIGDITSNSASATTQAKYAVSATLASKLDLKFDDGMPFSGNIASGRNVVDSALTGAAAVSCHNLTTAENATTGAGIVGTVTYQQSNNINNGCLVAYAI